MQTRHSLFGVFTRDDIAALSFVVIGGAGVAIILTSAGLREARLGETLLVIATTVLLAGLIQVLTQLVRWLSEGRVRAEFQQFFGAGRAAVGYVPDLRSVHDLAGWEPEHSTGARPKGITQVVPIEDLHAAIEMAQLFEQFGVEFTISRDSTLEDHAMPKRPFVAIGLGFNRVTSRLAEHTNLFRIVYHDTHYDIAKDDFLFAGELHPKPVDNRDYAIIVRVPVPHGDLSAAVPGIVCAGRMAAGTAAAGEFLRCYWPTLYSYYRREGRSLDRDVLVVELQHGTASTSAIETRHRFAKVFAQDGEGG